MAARPTTRYPVVVQGQLDDRAQPLALAGQVVPRHPTLSCLVALWLAFAVLTVVAGSPSPSRAATRGRIFDFNVGVLRWTWHVPVLRLHPRRRIVTRRSRSHDDPDYPPGSTSEYPERLSRGLVWVKSWLLAIPQYLARRHLHRRRRPSRRRSDRRPLRDRRCQPCRHPRYPGLDLRVRDGTPPLVVAGHRLRRADPRRVPAVPPRHGPRRGPADARRRTPSGTVDPHARELVVTLLFAVFLIAHGLVHLAIYAAPVNPDQPVPFDPGRSWVLGRAGPPRRHAAAASLSPVPWRPPTRRRAGCLRSVPPPGAAVAGIAAVLGLVLKSLWFHPWLTFGVAIDIAIAVTVLVGWPASL